MNRIGINLWNWVVSLDEGCLPLVEHVAELGFTAVELPMSVPTLSNCDEFRRTIQRLGLEVSLCACMTAGRDISNFDPEVKKATEGYLRGCIDTAAALGAEVLAGPLYAGGGKRHLLAEADRKAEWELAVQGLASLADYAAQRGVKLALEPINRYRTSVVNTTPQVLAMVADIGRDNVGVHFDTYQSCIEDNNVCSALEQVLKAGKLFHFHACANHRGAPGTGHLPWLNLLKLLKDYDYQGHVTMETFCPGSLDAGWVPLAESQDALALTGLRFLQTHL